MSNIAGTLNYDTKLDTKDYEKGLKSISASTIAKGQIMADVFKSIAKEIYNVVKQGVQYNATIEQLSTSFEVMTGSADEATKLIEKLKKVGAETPYELTGLASTVQLLMQYGMTSDEAYNSTLQLGDIAQGSADKMQGIALALGQMSSYGKVTLVDIKQMIGNGFNPLNEISKTTGESMESLYDRISDGTLTVEEVTNAFKSASSEGGAYFQSMEKQSKTLNGQLSTLKDNWGNLTGTVAKKFSDALKNDILPKLNEFIEYLTKKIETTNWDEVIKKIKTIGAVIIPVITAFTVFSTGLKIISFLKELSLAFQLLNTTLLANPVLLIVAGIAALVAGFIYLWNTSEDFRQFWIDLWNNIKDFFATIWEAISKFFTETIPNVFNNFIDFLKAIPDKISEFVKNVIEFIEKIPYYIGYAIGYIIGLIVKFFVDLWKFVTEDIPNFIGKVIEWFKKLPEEIEKIITAIVEWFKKLPEKIWNAIISVKNTIVNWVKDLIDTSIVEIPKFVNKVVEFFQQLPKKMLDIGKNIVEGIWDGITNTTKWLKDKVEGFAKGILDGMKKALGIKSPSTKARDLVGKQIPAGVAIGITANTDSALNSIDKMNNEIMNKMSKAVNIETGKSSFNGISGSVSQILSSNATFNGNFVVKAEVEEGTLFEASQRITTTKTLQTGFGG